LGVYTIADGKLAVKEQIGAGTERFAPWKELAGKLQDNNPHTAEKVGMSGGVGNTKDGRTVLFVVGPAGHMEVRWETRMGEEECRWSKWHGIPGKVISSPVVQSSPEFGPEVFTVASAGQVVTTWMASSGDERDWIQWRPMEGPSVAPESLFVMNYLGETHLFAVEAAPTRRVLHAARMSLNPKEKFGEWETIEGPVPVIQTPVAVGDSLSGTLDLFVMGEDHNLYTSEKIAWKTDTPAVAGPAYERAAPAKPMPFPALALFDGLDHVKFKFSPSAATNLDGRITVVALDTTGRVWIRYQVRELFTNKDAPIKALNNPNHLAWSEWHALDGEVFLSQPALFPLRDGRLEIFVLGKEEHAPLYHSTQPEIDSLFPRWEQVKGRKATALQGLSPNNLAPRVDAETDLTVPITIGGKKASDLMAFADKIASKTRLIRARGQ
jgi:hypothetical protein